MDANARLKEIKRALVKLERLADYTTNESERNEIRNQTTMIYHHAEKLAAISKVHRQV